MLCSLTSSVILVIYGRRVHFYVHGLSKDAQTRKTQYTGSARQLVGLEVSWALSPQSLHAVSHSYHAYACLWRRWTSRLPSGLQNAGTYASCVSRKESVHQLTTFILHV
jgi:hypothetical protein